MQNASRKHKNGTRNNAGKEQDSENAPKDEEVTHHRDLLTHLKHQRDKLRADNARLKQQGGMMASDDILEDFEARADETERLQALIAELKRKHAAYTNVILAANSAQAAQAANGGLVG